MLTANMTCLDGLREAYRYASYSHDPSIRNGAILVDKSRGIVSHGFNHLVGLEGKITNYLGNEWKYQNTVHAEVDAILSAAKSGYRVSGLTLVSPWSLCCECAKVVVKAGISEVIAHKECMKLTPERWKDDIAMAISMLDRCGVRYEQVTGVIGVTMRFDGKDIEL